jgi:hypothetical protein
VRPEVLPAIEARLRIQEADDRLIAAAIVSGESFAKRRARHLRAAHFLLH